MTQSLRPVVLILALTACAPTPNSGTVPDTNQQLTQLKDEWATQCHHPGIEAALEDAMEEHGLLACNVAVGDDEHGLRMIHSATLAELDPDLVLPAGAPTAADFDHHTPMPVGSVSKIATSIALLDLWSDGYLGTELVVLEGGLKGTRNRLLTSLTVGELLDDGGDYPEWVQDITVHELLTHRGGIDDGSWVRNDDPAPSVSPADQYGLYIPSDDVEHVVADIDDEGLYSNMGYLLLGAIIDEIVQDEDFDGYPASGPYGAGGAAALTPGYETWVWWVLSGKGGLQPRVLLTPALQSKARAANDGIEGIPDSWSLVDGEYVAEPAWAQDGWEAPSGGWTMTVGDQLRLGFQVAAESDQRFVSDEVAEQLQETWGTTNAGDYGYGVQVFAQTERFHGHGGRVLGYAAGTYRIADPGPDGVDPGDGLFVPEEPVIRHVAISCNTEVWTTSVDDEGEEELVEDFQIPAVAQAVYDGWGSSDPVCTSVLIPGNLGKAETAVAGSFFATWASDLADEAARYGLAATVAEWLEDLDDGRYGSKALTAAKGGDWDRASQCALLWAGDTGSWSCR